MQGSGSGPDSAQRAYGPVHGRKFVEAVTVSLYAGPKLVGQIFREVPKLLRVGNEVNLAAQIAISRVGRRAVGPPGNRAKSK